MRAISWWPSLLDLYVGGLVWIKWKKIPFWPALVLKLYYTSKVKVKRVKVAFIEYQTDSLLGESKCINRSFVIEYQRASVFPLSKDCHKHVTGGLQCKLKQQFYIAWRRVESYLFWSDLTTRPFVWQFFGIDDVSKGASSDTESLSEASADDTQMSSYSHTDEHIAGKESYLNQYTMGPTHLKDTLNSTSEKQLNTLQPQQLDSWHWEQYERSQLLIDYMNTINGRKRIMLRLRGIERGQVKWAFKEKFDYKDKSLCESFILRSQGFGPICNFDQVYEVFQLCLKLCSAMQKPSQKETNFTHQPYLLEVLNYAWLSLAVSGPGSEVWLVARALLNNSPLVCPASGGADAASLPTLDKSCHS